MLNIDEAGLIGKGAHRACYKHPENKSLCVKIMINGSHCSVEIKREKKYYQHLERRGVSWEMIPRYYGDVETNLGKGSLFDLVTDKDGVASKSLEYYLSSNSETEKYRDSLFKSLSLLKEYLLKNRIITMDIKPYNILCQKTESGISRSFIVDNIYSSEFIPVSTYISYFARGKILRKWQRLEESLINIYKENKALQQMLKISKTG